MAFNLITTEWAAYKAGPSGGADVFTICDALATMLQAALNSTGDTPVPAAWGYAVQQPTGQWPNLIITPGPDPHPARNFDSTARLRELHLVAWFIFGPSTGDALRYEQAGKDYPVAVDLAIGRNQDLNGRVIGLQRLDDAWGDMRYAGSDWYVLQCRIHAYAAHIGVTQYERDF